MTRAQSILAGAAALILLAACDAPSASRSVDPLADGTYITVIGNNQVRLTVENGEPVAFSSPTYTARNVERLPNGDIRVDAARITNVEAAEDAFFGTWQQGIKREGARFALRS